MNAITMPNGQIKVPLRIINVNAAPRPFIPPKQADSSAALAHPPPPPLTKVSGHVADLGTPSEKKKKKAQKRERHEVEYTGGSEVPSTDVDGERASEFEQKLDAHQQGAGKLSKKNAGRRSTVTELSMTEGALRENSFVLIATDSLSPSQRKAVPDCFVGDRVPVCVFCQNVVVGKPSAYSKHKSCCPKRSKREEAEQEAAVEATRDFEANEKCLANAITSAFIESGVSVSQACVFVRRLLKMDLPPSTFYRQLWGEVKDLSAAMMSDLRLRLRGKRIVIAIDAGVSQLTKQHMLVAVAYYRGRGFLLPPAYQSYAYTAQDLSRALDAILACIGLKTTDVSVWMADGCRVNTAFFEMLDHNKLYIETALSDKAQQQSQLKEFTKGCIKVYCRGHWINVVLSHCQGSLAATYDKAWRLLVLFNQSLYNADSRGRRVKDFISTFGAAEERASTENRDKLAHIVAALYEFPDPASAATAIRAHAPLPDDVELTYPALEQFATQYLAELPPVKSIAKSTAGGPIKISHTRWLAGRYQAIEYLYSNFEAIRYWVKEEDRHYPVPSTTEIKQMHSDDDDAFITYLQLGELLNAMKPVADYIAEFSEERPSKPFASKNAPPA